MNCKKCGIRLNDSWESCPACGTAVKEEKLCSKCGYKLDDEWKSCPACGAEVEVKKELLCAKCGYKLKDEWNSCPACGAAIEKEIFCISDKVVCISQMDESVTTVQRGVFLEILKNFYPVRPCDLGISREENTELPVVFAETPERVDTAVVFIPEMAVGGEDSPEFINGIFC